MTSGESDRLARAIAATLQDFGSFGERVIVLLAPGLDYIAAFYGCLYAGAIAVPVCPPGLVNFSSVLTRLDGIVDNAEPRFVLTSSSLLATRDLILEKAPRLRTPIWIAVDRITMGAEHSWQEPALGRNALALLQYTSGSTGHPKGVMVSHGNLLHNTEQMRRRLRGAADDRHVGWLPPYHDMGLVAGILMVSQFGMTVTLMSPLSFIKQPMRWIRALSDSRATITGGAPFGFELACRRIAPEDLEGIDLSTIRVACIAAEPIRRATLDRFVERFGPVGFRRDAFLPCYGLAESTLMATGGTAEAPIVTRRFSRSALRAGCLSEILGDEADSFDLVGCGPVIDGLDLIVVDPVTRRLSGSGQIGEVWLSGMSVAGGYWRRFGRTARDFGARLADSVEACRHPGPFLRTGDLGTVCEGELFVCGRIKDVMIVNGIKHHPEDLESTLDGCHRSLVVAGAAVFSVDAGEGERIVVVHEVVTRGLDRSAVVGCIRQAIAQVHGVEVWAVVLIRARTLPKTSSGKVQRHACRAAFVGDGLPSTVFVWHRGRSQVPATLTEGAAL